MPSTINVGSVTAALTTLIGFVIILFPQYAGMANDATAKITALVTAIFGIVQLIDEVVAAVKAQHNPPLPPAPQPPKGP